MDRIVEAPYDALASLLIISLLTVVVLTFRSYGFTTDDGFGYDRAVAVVDFVGSLGTTTRAVSTMDIHNVYGAMPDVVALVLQNLIPELSFNSRLLVSALFGVSGVYYTYRVGADFATPATGFFAALFLACNPMWFGYMFINIKDIPFATTLLAATYYCVAAVSAQRGSRWVWLKLAISVGLLATTKLTGIIMLGFTVLSVLLALIVTDSGCSVRIDLGLFARSFSAGTAACVGCLVCFVLFWPQFFFFSPTEIFSVAKLFMNYDRWEGTVLIHGNVFRFDQIPRYYLITYFAISMPLFLAALVPVGVVYSIARRDALPLAAIAICGAFFSYQFITRAQVYNGYRHFIFLIPFISLVAAHPIACLSRPEAAAATRAAALAYVFVGILISVISMYRLFPYEYSFYNALVGGMAGADGRYDIDVRRSALREALMKIETATKADTIRIYSCGSSFNFDGHPRFKQVSNPTEADYVVALRKGCAPELFNDLAVAGDIRRENVILAVIYSRPSDAR
jgi:hypothetical protein